MTELHVDPRRVGRFGSTGIYVRAMRGERWDNCDISELTLDSLYAWLRSRGGENEWAEKTVAILLGHRPD